MEEIQVFVEPPVYVVRIVKTKLCKLMGCLDGGIMEKDRK